jgi:hypothetical protein
MQGAAAHFETGQHCRWITGTGVSHVNLVFARIVHDGTEQGIGGLIVEKGMPGFRSGGTTQAQRTVIASAIFRRRFSQRRDEG